MVEKEGEKTSSKVKSVPKKLLLETIIKKIDYYSSKNAVSDVDLYYLIKEFFAEFLDMKYEFSLDELIHELDKIYIDNSLRDQTVEFIEKIKIIEYADKSFSPEYIKELVRELSLIARKLATITDTSNKGFWAKVFGKKKEANNTPIPRKKEEPKQEIKASVLESKADTTFSKVPDIEENTESFESLKQYKSEEDSTPTPAPAPKKEEITVKRNYNSKTIEKYSKNYTETDKTEEPQPEIRKSYVSNTNYDWSSDQILKKEKRRSEASSISDKSEKPKKELKSAKAKTEQLATKDEFEELLDKAKSTKKKEELIELYKKIHERYDTGNVDFQAKYYQDILDLYTKLSKMK